MILPDFRVHRAGVYALMHYFLILHIHFPHWLFHFLVNVFFFAVVTTFFFICYFPYCSVSIFALQYAHAFSKSSIISIKSVILIFNATSLNTGRISSSWDIRPGWIRWKPEMRSISGYKTFDENPSYFFDKVRSFLTNSGNWWWKTTI